MSGKKQSTNPERAERTNFTGNVPLNNAKTAENMIEPPIQLAPRTARNRLREEARTRGNNATYRRLINENFKAEFEAHPNIQKRMQKVMEERRRIEERRTPEEREARNRLRREAHDREDYVTYRQFVNENIKPIMMNRMEQPQREERKRFVEEERKRIRKNIISRNAHYRNMQRRLAEIREENRIEENQRRREENQRKREEYERRSLLVENGILEAPITPPPVARPLATVRVPNRNQMRQNALSRINMSVYHQLVNENVEAEMRRKGLLGGRRKIQKKKQVKGKGKGKSKGKK